jgi:phosphate transport system substrate-binding protein
MESKPSHRLPGRRSGDRLAKWLLAVGVISLLYVVGCGGSGSSRADNRPTSGRLTITGSSTVAPLVSEIAKRYEERFPDVRIDVQTGGSGKGIADVRNGVSDIGMASRALKADEKNLLSHQIAADGVCLIVHGSNDVPELAPAQVVSIFRGVMRNWQDVGGADLPVTVVHKAEGRATLEVFLEHFDLENPDVEADVIVGDNEHGIKTVAGAPGAIGYVSIGTAEANQQSGVPIRLLPLGQVAPTRANVAAGDFPLSRPLILVTRDSTDPLAAAFIQFCQSEEVHDLIAAQYFVPLEN